MEHFTTRNLPISIRSFADFRERECVYVDKTQFIPRLLFMAKEFARDVKKTISDWKCVSAE